MATLVQKDYEGSRQFIYSTVISQGSIHILKHVIDRERPDGGGLSFPSGHASSAFLGSSSSERKCNEESGVPTMRCPVL